MSWAELIDLGWKFFLGVMSLAGAVYGGWKARQAREKQAVRDAIERAEGRIELVDKDARNDIAQAREEIARVERAMDAKIQQAENRFATALDTMEDEFRDILNEHSEQLARAATKDDIGNLVRELGKVETAIAAVKSTAEGTSRQVTLIYQHLLGKSA